MKLFYKTPIENGKELKKLYSELWDNPSTKSEEEQSAIIDRMNEICEKALKYEEKVLEVFLKSAEDAAVSFEAFKKEALKNKPKSTQEVSERILETEAKEHADIAEYLRQAGVKQLSKGQTLEEKIGYGSLQDQKIQKCIEKHNLNEKYKKEKYENAKFGTPEYIKKDFWLNFNFSKHHSLDEAIDERVSILKQKDKSMDYDKYKKALLKGFPSNMEEFVNLIEPGWSKKTAPKAESQNPKVGEKKYGGTR